MQQPVSAGPSLGDLLKGMPPPPEAPPPPDPEAAKAAAAAAAASKRLLAPASERDLVLEAFLAKHRISPSTSFLMLKLTKEKAAQVMAGVEEHLANFSEAGEREAELAALTRLKLLGIRTTTKAGGGSWTSTERTASPFRAPPPPTAREERGDATQERGDGVQSPPAPVAGLQVGEREDASAFPGLPSLDGLLGPGLLASLPKVGAEEGEEERGDGGDLLAPRVSLRINRPEPAAVVRTPPPAGDEVGEAADRAADGASSEGARVFVKNLDKGTGERELRDLFGRHGAVSSVEIPREDASGLGKGFAFVDFARADEAERCVKALHFTKPWGRALIVELLHGPGQKDSAAAPPPGAGKEGAEKAEKAKQSSRQKPSGLRKKRRGRRRSSGSGSSADESGSTSSGSDSSDSSGWSRYTVRSKGRKAKARRRRGRRRRSSSSGSRSSDSDDSSRSRRRPPQHAMEGMQPPMGWPGMPPPHMMPPPWGMPPWGNAFPAYNAEDAERELRREERRAKREEENQVWEDHPARKQQRHRSKSSSASRKPQRERSSGSSRSRRRRSSRSRGRRKDPVPGSAPQQAPPLWPGCPMPMPPWGPGPPPPYGMQMPGGRPPPPFGMPPGMPPPPAHGPPGTGLQQPPPPAAPPGASPAKAAELEADSDDSDVDMVKVQEDINFADI